jgi:hypothetical protein
MATRKRVRSRPAKARKKSAHTKSVRAVAKQTAQPAIDQRLDVILQAIGTLHARLDRLEGGRTLSVADVVVTKAALASKRATLKKTSGPDAVRVVDVLTGEDVLSRNSTSGSTRAVPIGSTIDVQVEINGSASFTIEVSNALPDKITEPGFVPLRII